MCVCVCVCVCVRSWFFSLCFSSFFLSVFNHFLLIWYVCVKQCKIERLRNINPLYLEILIPAVYIYIYIYI